jgi:hypothetical protein
VNPGNSTAQGQCLQTGNITSCTFQGSAVANISRAVPDLTFQATDLNSSLQLVNLGLSEQSSGWWSVEAVRLSGQPCTASLQTTC